MLIAEVGAPNAAHPASQTSYCEKTGQLSTLDSTFRLSNTALIRVHSRCQNWLENRFKGMQGCFIRVFYRSWVPDKDLGASIGELVCWDLEVGHQHLHSFPMGSQKGQMGHPKHT